MTVRLNRDYITYNYVTETDEELPKATEISVFDFSNDGANAVINVNGNYVIPGAYLEYVGEDEPDGI